MSRMRRHRHRAMTVYRSLALVPPRMADLRPFFSYFGGKWTLAPHYAPPSHSMIVEPFAGSAGYATRYANREVILVEREPRLATLWRWLVGVSVDEVMGLPITLREAAALEGPARSLIGFWLGRGRTSPASTTTSSWLVSGKWPSSFWGEYARERIARQVPMIRHWKIIEGNYADAPDASAHWFVDPPYVGSRHYRAGVDDYAELGRWCQRCRGHVTVCERDGAKWLPFRPFRRVKSIARSAFSEVVWTKP